MAGTEFLIGLTIIVILVLFFTGVLIGVKSRREVVFPKGVTGTVNGFLSPCFDGICPSGLSCDGNTFVCKRDVGQKCSDYYDCSNGLLCSGVCVNSSTLTGALNGYCPCGVNLTCVDRIDGTRVCKKIAVAPCTSNSDCASNYCYRGSCAAALPLSHICTSDSQCGIDRQCSAGYCQMRGISSGSARSACSGKCVTFTGAVCSVGLDCVCADGANQPGTCLSRVGLNSTCIAADQCYSYLDCIQGKCEFPYDNPNIILRSGGCIDGMTPTGSICLNDPRLGCESGNQCVSGVCSSRGTLASLPFLGSISVNPSSPSITPLLSSPTGAIHPYNLLCTRDSGIDTLYMVDSILGIFRSRIDSKTFAVTEDWNMQVVSTQTMRVIDLAIANGTMYVAFQNGSNDLILMGTSFGSLIPFNPTTRGTGPQGTQYSTAGNPLSIDYIDVDTPNDVNGSGGDILISSGGTVYVKTRFNLYYSVYSVVNGVNDGLQLTTTMGRTKFYYDIEEYSGLPGPALCRENVSNPQHPVMCPSYNNVAFVLDTATGMSALLNFSGNAAQRNYGTALFDGPIPSELDKRQTFYRVYSHSIGNNPRGMGYAQGIALASAYDALGFVDNIVMLYDGAVGTVVPYKIGPNTLCTVGSNSFYILSLGTCG